MTDPSAVSVDPNSLLRRLGEQIGDLTVRLTLADAENTALRDENNWLRGEKATLQAQLDAVHVDHGEGSG